MDQNNESMSILNNSNSKYDSKTESFTEEKRMFIEASAISLNYIEHYAYKHGVGIYQFMDKFNIGNSAYGEYLDILGRSKSQISSYLIKNANNITPEMYSNLLKAMERNINFVAHRLAGHHVIADFPFKDFAKYDDFLEHIFSDLGGMGLPILPEKLLEDLNLIKYCNKLTQNWNFINGFGLLTAVVSIYNSSNNLVKAINKNKTISGFEEVVKEFGLSGLEVAFALSTSNPLLMIGAILQLSSSIVAYANDSGDVYFKQLLEGYSLEIEINSGTLEKELGEGNLEQEMSKGTLEEESREGTLQDFLNYI